MHDVFQQLPDSCANEAREAHPLDVARRVSQAEEQDTGPMWSASPVPTTPSHPGLAADTPRVSVVIPAYNEALNLAHVLPRIPGTVAEVVLVDGHSTDETIQVAQSVLPSIRIVRQYGRGKGDAVRCGVRAATGDIIVMMDADGSTDPGEISRFVDALIHGADVAKGSRFLRVPHRLAGSADITLVRRLGNSGLNLLVNLLFGTHFTDLCYGFNAFWRESLERFDVDCDGFEVETLISLRAFKARLRMVEVPSFERQRLNGASNLRAFRDGWRVLKTIAREKANGQSVIHHATARVAHRVARRAPADARQSALSQPALSTSELQPDG